MPLLINFCCKQAQAIQIYVHIYVNLKKAIHMQINHFETFHMQIKSPFN